jgi:uncharacterized protein
MTPQSREEQEMSELRFRPRLTASEDEFSFNVDPDGQVFTILFSDLQANLDEKESSDVVAARVFSIVLPLDGAGDAVDITFAVSGFALTTRGARGYVGLSVNGKTSATRFPPSTDREYVQELKFEAGPTFECHLSVFILAERDSQHPLTGAGMSIASIDAKINRRRAGKFVLKKGSAGTYHFNLMAPSGEVIAASESYKSKASAVNGVESVKRNAADATVDDQTTN